MSEFPWDEVVGHCAHPREQGERMLRANCRLEVKLQNGTTVEVCRLCWERIVPTGALVEPPPARPLP